MLNTISIVYIAVISVLALGIIYVSFAEVLKSGVRLKISRKKVLRGEEHGREKKKKKATTSKAKT